jgi:hypothetical protein
MQITMKSVVPVDRLASPASQLQLHSYPLLTNSDMFNALSPHHI